MHVKDAVLSAYATSDRLTNAYLGDFTDEDLLVRSADGQNHVAWQLGHLISTSYNVVNMVRPGTSPALPEGFLEAHARDEVSTRSDDGGRFFKKDDYLRLWQAQRE